MLDQTVSRTQAAALLARLERLPATRSIWTLVTLLSLGGMFEFYDLFLTGYIIPGLVKAGLLANVSVAIFSGPALFVAATFTGLFIGTFVFGFVADRFGRRAVFTVSLLCYCAATLVMAAQTTGFGVCMWRLIAGIGIGVELVTIDTYIAELVPKHVRGRAFAFNQVIQFAAVPSSPCSPTCWSRRRRSASKAGAGWSASVRSARCSSGSSASACPRAPAG